MIDNIWTGFVDVGGGISTPGEAVNVSISPNPLTAVSKVQCSNVPQGSFIELYDIRGRLILKRNISIAGALDLNRSDLYPGLFIWKVTSGINILQIGKLIVQ
jgi:hypothetical protein